MIGGEIQSKTQKRLVEEGRHPFQGSSSNEKMLALGIHPSQKKENREAISARQQEKARDGTHSFFNPENRGQGFVDSDFQRQNQLNRLAKGNHPSQIKIQCPHCERLISSNAIKKHIGACQRGK